MHIIYRRQGQMDFCNSYFYTQTIVGFRRLLIDDNLKLIIVNSLKYLTEKGLVEVLAFVIMPNHIHLIWNILTPNGKENPSASFSKHTSHQFKAYLKSQNPSLLEKFLTDKSDRAYQFWKIDPLAIPLSNQEILIQKLEYIHENPIREKWKLCECPDEYKWSSSKFYYNGDDIFGFLKDFRE